MTASIIPQMSNRRKGSRSLLPQGSASFGCRKPGKRCHLGKNDPHRPLALATALWVEREEERGRDIFRADVIKQFTWLLVSEEAVGAERQQDGLMLPGDEKDFAHEH